MSRLRVLIVDDSVVMRRMISDMVQSDPALEVAGIAHHGRIALAKIPQVTPDIVTLDIDMPEMDGLETLGRIRAEYPDLPVIMVIGLTEDGAKLTLDALAMGAADYVTKPSGVGVNPANVEQTRLELIGKIKALGAAKLSRQLQYFAIEHVRRELNRDADALANVALDSAGVPKFEDRKSQIARGNAEPRSAEIRATAPTPPVLAPAHANPPRTVRARFVQGVFVPADPVALPEGSEVTLDIRIPLKQ